MAVGVDANDNVHAFNRGEYPMMVFDRDGNFLRSWGKGLFPRAHGITLAADDTMFCTDDGDHTVRQCTLDGKVLFTLGMSGMVAISHNRSIWGPIGGKRHDFILN